LPPEMAGIFKQRGCYTPLFGGAGPPYLLPRERATTRRGGAKGWGTPPVSSGVLSFWGGPLCWLGEATATQQQLISSAVWTRLQRGRDRLLLQVRMETV